MCGIYAHIGFVRWQARRNYFAEGKKKCFSQDFIIHQFSSIIKQPPNTAHGILFEASPLLYCSVTLQSPR